MPEKRKAKSNAKARKNSSWLRSQKTRLLLVVSIFGIVGVGYLLYQTFAATNTVKYWGTLTKTNPTVSYKLTTGAGNMDIAFTNNTADLVLTVTNSSNNQVGAVKSVGKDPVKLNLAVTPGTYTVSLNPSAAYKGKASKKGYSIQIAYPMEDLVNPTAVISSPLSSTTIKGTVDYTVNSQDDVGVSKVEFYVAGTKLDTDTTSPYSIRWDTTVLKDGVYQLAAKSYDTSGNVGVASGEVTIKNAVPVASSRFPGDPNPKVNNKAYWGTSITGNGDPARHEDVTGVSLAERRTFWTWDQAANLNSGMYNTVQNDIANNRLPFISIKTPGWAAMASGQYDDKIDAMLKKLNSYGKPVWLVVHHEPEGGDGTGPDDPGGAPAWRAMQSKVRQRITATGTNQHIAFMPILMGYTWSQSSGRNPDDWYVPGIWDAYVVDHYVKEESATSVAAAKGGSFLNFVKWAEARNLPFGIGEWANKGTNATAAQEMKDFWNWSFNNKKDMVVYSYFDSSLNTGGDSMELTGEPLTMFHTIMKDSRVQRINDLR